MQTAFKTALLALSAQSVSVRMDGASADSDVEARNIELVKDCVAEYQKGNPEGYIACLHDDFRASIWSGLMEGGDDIRGPDGMRQLMKPFAEQYDVEKFEPVNWAAKGNTVYFTVNWRFAQKGCMPIDVSAVVRKVIRDGKIAEKYHMIDAEHVKKMCVPTKEVEEKNIKLVKDLVAEYQAGNPEGYIAGLHEDFRATILSGLVPGGDDIRGPDGMREFLKPLSETLEITKFEPTKWAANGDTVFFVVNWEFALKDCEPVQVSATVRKVIRDGKIVEKYHMIDAEHVRKISKCNEETEE